MSIGAVITRLAQGVNLRFVRYKAPHLSPSVSELKGNGRNHFVSEPQVFHICLVPKAQGDDRRRKQLSSPGEPLTKYQESWTKKTTDGRSICIRFNIEKCRSGKTYRYAHVCLIPNAKSEPWWRHGGVDLWASQWPAPKTWHKTA